MHNAHTTNSSPYKHSLHLPLTSIYPISSKDSFVLKSLNVPHRFFLLGSSFTISLIRLIVFQKISFPYYLDGALLETMGSTFNPQILVEKLAKLNSSQQSIETLSHWCIFHMNKAKQVVETWARQFHCSPRDQRLAFLYLANDILQNSRRKGSEFVGEFWKVLPDALHDVMDNRDESGRNAALRLVRIWEERKVFGSRGQILMEELVGRHLETSNRNGKNSGLKLKQSAGNALEKIVSGYQIVYGGELDEDAMISKCKNTISCIEKVDKEIGGDTRSAQVNGSAIMEELKGHHATLRDCIEQLSAVESSRINLVCYLREALQEQETKLDQIRNQIQAAQSQSEKADNLCRELLNPGGTKLLPEQGMNTSKPQSYIPGTGEQSAPVTYTRQISFSEQSEKNTNSAAAAVAARLTASTSSAEMLSYALSSLVSEGVIGNSVKESSSNVYPPEKRVKTENDQSCSTLTPQPPVPPFPHPDSLQHSTNPPATSEESSHDMQPPPPSSTPPLPPMPPMVTLQAYTVPPFMQSARTITYSYSTSLQPPMYPMIGGSLYTPATPPPPPPNAYQNYQNEGGSYSQASSMAMAPMSRQ